MELKPMTCRPDNVAEFNQALKTHLPGAHDLIKAFMARGMMQGLRGVTLAPVGTLPAGVQPVLPLTAENRLQALHNAHPSEQGVMFAPGDVQILNTGSKAQLYTQLAAALREARQ